MGCLGTVVSFILMISTLLAGSSGYVVFFFFLCMMVSIFGAGIIGQKEEENTSRRIKESLNEYINNLKINSSQQFLGDDGESAIVIDEDNKKVAIIFNTINNDMVLRPSSKYEYQSEIFNYQDILKSEIIKDGKSITSTSATGTVGRALLGGMLAGGAGAVVGGLSGEKETIDIQKSVDLQVVVNDSKKSTYRIRFGAFEGVTNNINSYTIEETDEIVHHWHNLLSHIINLNNTDIKKDYNEPSISIADELKKFGDLFKEGLITKEEFDIEKEKILNK